MENRQKELQDVLLEIAKEFHRICEKNGIQYYMLGGTMLGAVRHKGFIPWDDDMDFGVLESEWNRLIVSLKKELPVYYKIRDINNTVGIQNPSIKIEDARTLMRELDKDGAKDRIGLNIDIFPLNYTGAKKGFFSRNGVIQNIIRLNWCRVLDYKSKPFLKRISSRIFKKILSPFPKNFLVVLVQKFLIKKEGDCIANFWGAWINKETVPVEVMGRPLKYAFEDQFFWGVAKPDEYLKSLYGNYMEIPPKDKIHYHIIEWDVRND